MGAGRMRQLWITNCLIFGDNQSKGTRTLARRPRFCTSSPFCRTCIYGCGERRAKGMICFESHGPGVRATMTDAPDRDSLP